MVGPMRGRRFGIWVLIWGSCCGLCSCGPEIGDECTSSADCSDMGDRLCDSSQPGGYCTRFNCEPDSCPEEAACIAFLWTTSAAKECQDPGDSRRMRTFCLRRCSSQDDCRSGYVCADLGETGNDYGAMAVDLKRSGGRVCAVPMSAASYAEAGDSGSDYCSAGDYQSDGSFDVTPIEPEGSAGQAGGGGSAGSNSSAGSSGVSESAGSSGVSESAGSSGISESAGSSGSDGGAR